MGDLAKATELAGEDGRFSAQLSRDWEIWGPNGGYLAAIALRAAGRMARIQRVASLHVHYLRVARFDRVDVQAQVVHAGRQAESISVSLLQQDKLILTALVRTAAVGAGLAHDVADAPEVQGPEHLPTVDQLIPAGAPRYTFWENYDRRVLQPEAWALPRVALSPRWREWLRYRAPIDPKDAFLDAARAAVLIDTMCWPAAYLRHLDESFIAPSLDLTVLFHRPAQSEWLLVDAHSPLAEAGMVAGSCQVWNEQRQLVASGGGQMLCVRKP